jgi:hypothetical protein
MRTRGCCGAEPKYGSRDPSRSQSARETISQGLRLVLRGLTIDVGSAFAVLSVVVD